MTRRSLIPVIGSGLMIQLARGDRMQQPLSILLATNGKLGLSALMRNNSAEPRAVLHDAFIQPSKLVLSDSTGRTLEPFDMRQIEKFDPTVRREMFIVIPAKGEHQLISAQFRRTEKGYRLLWGPFDFKDVPAGAYQARLEWESKIDTFTDDSGRQDRMVGLWKGNLVSNSQKITVP